MNSIDLKLWRQRLGLPKYAAAKFLKISHFRMDLYEDSNWKIPYRIGVYCFAIEQAYILAYRIIFSGRFDKIPGRVRGHVRAAAKRRILNNLLDCNYADIQELSNTVYDDQLKFDIKGWPGLGARYIALETVSK